MTTRVLVPMDDSEMAEHALEHALDVHPGADITVLTVVGEPSSMMGEATGLALEDDIEHAAEDLAKDVFERANEIADEHDRSIDTQVAVGSASKEIVKRAEEYDVVVVGSHGGSMLDYLIVGNVAEKVFRHSPTPVTIVR